MIDKKIQQRNKSIAVILLAFMTLAIIFAVVGIFPASTVSAEEIYESINSENLISSLDSNEYKIDGFHVDGSTRLSTLYIRNVYLKEGSSYYFGYNGYKDGSFLFYSGPVGGSISTLEQSINLGSYFTWKRPTGYYDFSSKRVGQYDNASGLNAVIFIVEVKNVTPDGTQLKPYFVSAGYRVSGSYIVSGEVSGEGKTGIAEIPVTPNTAYYIDWNGTAGSDFVFDFNSVELGDELYNSYGRLYFKTSGDKIKLKIYAGYDLRVFPCLNICAFEDIPKAESFMADAIWDIKKPDVPDPPVVDPDPEPMPDPDPPITDPDPPIVEPEPVPDENKPVINPDNVDNGTVTKEEVVADIETWFKEIGVKIKAWFNELGENIKNWFETLWDNISNWFKETFGGNKE